MMEIKSVKIRRNGGEDDPRAEVVVLIEDAHGEYIELGRERLNSNFSTAWNLPEAVHESRRRHAVELNRQSQ